MLSYPLIVVNCTSIIDAPWLPDLSKIDASDMAEDFGEKYESGRLLAQSGLDIFRKVDAAVRRRQP